MGGATDKIQKKGRGDKMNEPKRNKPAQRVSIVTAALLSMVLSGCWFVVFPMPRLGPSLDDQFAEFVRNVADKPQPSAVAVAKDSSRWAWGGGWSAQTIAQAKSLAIEKCRQQATQNNIAAPCQIYAVNGVVVSQLEDRSGDRAETVSRECSKNSDCGPGKSCRTTSGGGTRCQSATAE
jgi:hypothetical protein